MRSEHIIILVALLIIWRLATRTMGAGDPPPDEPRTEQTTPPRELLFPNQIAEQTREAAIS